MCGRAFLLFVRVSFSVSCAHRLDALDYDLDEVFLPLRGSVSGSFCAPTPRRSSLVGGDDDHHRHVGMRVWMQRFVCACWWCA